MEELIKEARQVINKALMYGKPIVGFSGGKDGFVVGYLVNEIMPGVEMVCDISFCFDEIIDQAHDLAARHNFNVTYVDRFSDEWLKKNSDIIFTPDTKRVGWTFAVRQQKSLKLFAKERSAKVTFTGRRKYTNSVKSHIYSTKKNGMQAHPIRNWKKEHVWKFFDRIGEGLPYIYKTEFGKLSGCAPFYSIPIRKTKTGTEEECWNICRKASPKHTFEDRFRNA